MLEISLTFIGTSTLYAVAFWFGCRRIARHLRGNYCATGQVVEHVLLPLLGGEKWRPDPVKLPDDYSAFAPPCGLEPLSAVPKRYSRDVQTTDLD